MGLKLGLSQYGKSRLQVFDSRVLRRLSEPKEEEVKEIE
jgi:hypothetical protein